MWKECQLSALCHSLQWMKSESQILLTWSCHFGKWSIVCSVSKPQFLFSFCKWTKWMQSSLSFPLPPFFYNLPTLWGSFLCMIFKHPNKSFLCTSIISLYYFLFNFKRIFPRFWSSFKIFCLSLKLLQSILVLMTVRGHDFWSFCMLASFSLLRMEWGGHTLCTHPCGFSLFWGRQSIFIFFLKIKSLNSHILLYV